VTTTDSKPLDLTQFDRWMRPCGPHDLGIDFTGCACPEGDPRPVVAALVAEVERLRAELQRMKDTADRFADPSATGKIWEILDTVQHAPDCVDCAYAGTRACTRHMAEGLVAAVRQEHLVVLTMEAADQIIEHARKGGQP
jgi:hypothetical protein